MFVLVVLSLTLCLIALIYLLAHKHESFKEALSFTIVLLVRRADVLSRSFACPAACWPGLQGVLRPLLSAQLQNG